MKIVKSGLIHGVKFEGRILTDKVPFVAILVYFDDDQETGCYMQMFPTENSAEANILATWSQLESAEQSQKMTEQPISREQLKSWRRVAEQLEREKKSLLSLNERYAQKLDRVEKALEKLSTGNFSAPMELSQIEAYQAYASSMLESIRKALEE